MLFRTLAIVVLLVAPSAARRSLNSAIAFRAKVISVRDGSHVEVQFEGNKSWVRLSGIEAPELGDPFSDEAKSFLTKRCFGKTVELDARKDATGAVRFVAVAYTVINERRDAISVNEGLLSNGLARFKREEIEHPGFEEAERQAKAQRKGIWAEN